MEIPLQAKVECTDGICGTSVTLLINPVEERITHLVVRADINHVDYIVPIDFVSEIIAGLIQLRCTKAELEKLEPFQKTKFIEEKMSDVLLQYPSLFGYGGLEGVFLWPYVSPTGKEERVQVQVQERQIPPGDLAVARGMRVEAKDGLVGQVDEFVVNPENGKITHLVMRKGHLWGQKDVIIPLLEVEKIQGGVVSLKLDKQQVEQLPAFGLHRRWV